MNDNSMQNEYLRRERALPVCTQKTIATIVNQSSANRLPLHNVWPWSFVQIVKSPPNNDDDAHERNSNKCEQCVCIESDNIDSQSPLDELYSIGDEGNSFLCAGKMGVFRFTCRDLHRFDSDRLSWMKPICCQNVHHKNELRASEKMKGNVSKRPIRAANCSKQIFMNWTFDLTSRVMREQI